MHRSINWKPVSLLMPPAPSTRIGQPVQATPSKSGANTTVIFTVAIPIAVCTAVVLATLVGLLVWRRRHLQAGKKMIRSSKGVMAPDCEPDTSLLVTVSQSVGECTLVHSNMLGSSVLVISMSALYVCIAGVPLLQAELQSDRAVCLLPMSRAGHSGQHHLMGMHRCMRHGCSS